MLAYCKINSVLIFQSYFYAHIIEQCNADVLHIYVTSARLLMTYVYACTYGTHI